MSQDEPQQQCNVAIREPVHTIQVRVYGEPNYTEVTIDWALTGHDGLNVFTQLGNITGIPANRAAMLSIWKQMGQNYALSMVVFNPDAPDPVMALHTRRGVIDMLNSGHNNFVLSAFLRVSNRDNRLSVGYSLVHEDLIRNECTQQFCVHAHTRLLIRRKMGLVVNEHLNTILSQDLRNQPIEFRNRVFRRLNISQFINMTCQAAVREQPDNNVEHQGANYDRHRG